MSHGNLRLLLQEGEDDSVEVEVEDNLIMCSKMTDLRIMIIWVVRMAIMVRQLGVVPLEIEGKAKEILEVHFVAKVEDEVGLIKV